MAHTWQAHPWIPEESLPNPSPTRDAGGRVEGSASAPRPPTQWSWRRGGSWFPWTPSPYGSPTSPEGFCWGIPWEWTRLWRWVTSGYGLFSPEWLGRDSPPWSDQDCLWLPPHQRATCQPTFRRGELPVPTSPLRTSSPHHAGSREQCNWGCRKTLL